MKLQSVIHENVVISNELKLKLLNFVDSLEAKLPPGSLVGSLKTVVSKAKVNYLLPVMISETANINPGEIYICTVTVNRESNGLVNIMIHDVARTWLLNSENQNRSYSESFHILDSLKAEDLSKKRAACVWSQPGTFDMAVDWLSND